MEEQKARRSRDDCGIYMSSSAYLPLGVSCSKFFPIVLEWGRGGGSTFGLEFGHAGVCQGTSVAIFLVSRTSSDLGRIAHASKAGRTESNQSEAERAVRYSEIGAPDVFDLLSENGSEGS